MLMSAVLAVALGLTPTVETEAPQLVQVDAETIRDIGRYKQTIAKDGKTHLIGWDPMGRHYNISIDANGHVRGEVGDHVVSFDVSEPS